MKNQPVKEMLKEIDTLTQRINLLKGRLETHENLSVLYNKMLIERADLKQKLEEKNNGGFIESIIKNLSRKKDKSSEKKICDYFTGCKN